MQLRNTIRLLALPALTLIFATFLAVSASIAQYSNAPNYDQSRSPTQNQLIAACKAEWMSFANEFNGQLEGGELLADIRTSSSSSLLSGPYVDDLFNRRLCQHLKQCNAGARQAVQCFVDQELAGRAGCFRTPSMTVEEIADYGTTGRQDAMICSSPSAPISRPNVRAKVTPPSAPEKLPKARPAKTLPWSPKALSTDGSKLDPKFAAERADMLASCAVPIQQFGAAYTLTNGAANLLVEAGNLNDDLMALSAEVFKNQVLVLEKKIADGSHGARDIAAARAGRCVFLRRIAQLEGSPLINGAVDGSLTPLSIGGVDPPSKGIDPHIIAGNGKSAMSLRHARDH